MGGNGNKEEPQVSHRYSVAGNRSVLHLGKHVGVECFGTTNEKQNILLPGSGNIRGELGGFCTWTMVGRP